MRDLRPQVVLAFQTESSVLGLLQSVVHSRSGVEITIYFAIGQP